MTISKKILSLSTSKKIADAIEQEALKKNIGIVISIYDEGGNLKYFRRMDKTNYGSVRISQLKAKTSASLPLSSKALAVRSAAMPANPYNAIPDILLLGGGLPIITADGQHLGGIGISGATPELDEMLAQVGLDAITSDLK